MAHFGNKVEYALHTLLNISLAPAGAAPSSRELADFQRLPLAYVRKLLTEQQRAGLLLGAEGRQGGWQLARDATRISMLDIADAAQGALPLFDCQDVRRRCALWADDAVPARARQGVCEIHAVMRQAEDAMRARLAAVSLADLRDRVGRKSPGWVHDAAPRWFVLQQQRRGGGMPA